MIKNEFNYLGLYMGHMVHIKTKIYLSNSFSSNNKINNNNNNL